MPQILIFTQIPCIGITLVLYVLFKTRAGAQLECFIFDKARTANVLNGLQNDPSDEFIGEVILKINVV